MRLNLRKSPAVICQGEKSSKLEIRFKNLSKHTIRGEDYDENS